MKARDIAPGDLIGSRRVTRVVHGTSAGPVAVPVVLIYFDTGLPLDVAANYTPRNTTRQENHR